MNDKQKSLMGLHLSVVLFGGTGLFAKLIPLSAVDITAIRSFIAAAALLLLLKALSRRVLLAGAGHCALMLLLGVIIGLHWITFFHAMQVSSVAVGMIALYTYPVITVFLEPLWKGRLPHPSDIACAGLVFGGVCLMVPDFSLDNSVTRGVCWGVLSAFLFALRNVLQRHYLSQYRGDTSMLYQTFAAGMTAIFFLSCDLRAISLPTWATIVVLALFFTAVPHSLFAGSLRQLKAKTAGLIACLQPVYGTLLALALLHEVPRPATVLGGAIIVLAAAVESYRA
ncbi:DMT family transporter [Thermodesulfobacteriota bacterium]